MYSILYVIKAKMNRMKENETVFNLLRNAEIN